MLFDYSITFYFGAVHSAHTVKSYAAIKTSPVRAGCPFKLSMCQFCDKFFLLLFNFQVKSSFQTLTKQLAESETAVQVKTGSF